MPGKGKKQKNPKTPESISAKAEKKGKKKSGANTSPQNSKITTWRNYNNVGANKKYQQVPPKSLITD